MEQIDDYNWAERDWLLKGDCYASVLLFYFTMERKKMLDLFIGK